MSCERLATARYRDLAATALAALLFGSVHVAGAADSGTPGGPATERAVTLEAVAGSPVKRVVLSAKAVERLDVRTGEVGEQVIVPALMVGGVVVDPSAAGVGMSPKGRPEGELLPLGGTARSAKGAPLSAPAAKAPDAKAGSDAWIRVALSPVEWSKLAKDQPVRVLPLATRSGVAKDLTAMPSGEPPQDNVRSGMQTLFYVARSEGSGLVPGDRVRVEVQLTGGSDRQKVVPYSAVYYDAKGDAWVYVSTAPRAFLRERITVERVVGDLALLSSGPDVGTKVATVGAALLYGAEVFGK